MSDIDLISPFSISPESHIRVTRIKKIISREALDCSTISPFQYFRKCVDDSMENMYSDVGV